MPLGVGDDQSDYIGTALGGVFSWLNTREQSKAEIAGYSAQSLALQNSNTYQASVSKNISMALIVGGFLLAGTIVLVMRK